jgi:branched-subunit amino acid transport protein
VAALFMVLQAKLPALSFIPGAFLGAATAVSVVVGANGSWTKTIIALIVGALLGYLSEMLAGAMARRPRTAV